MAKIEKGAERSIDVKRKGNDKPVRKRTGFISIKEKDRNVGGIAIWKRALMLLHWENY
ncbi:hypothetical protein [Agathobacter sp.]|uniref:hypothetical protein n=1 Tax=Agathobacter sp. TaxID=2021311 RepID=UPI003FD6D83A